MGFPHFENTCGFCVVVYDFQNSDMEDIMKSRSKLLSRGLFLGHGVKSVSPNHDCYNSSHPVMFFIPTAN